MWVGVCGVCVCGVCVCSVYVCMYELPLPPNMPQVKHFYTNREQCQELTGYISSGRRAGYDWANT